MTKITQMQDSANLMGFFSLPVFQVFSQLILQFGSFSLRPLELKADRQTIVDKNPVSPLTIHVDINGVPMGKKGQSLFPLQINNNSFFLSPSQSTAIFQLVSLAEEEKHSRFDFWPSRLPDVTRMTFDCSAKCRDASFKCYSASVCCTKGILEG